VGDVISTIFTPYHDFKTLNFEPFTLWNSRRRRDCKAVFHRVNFELSDGHALETCTIKISISLVYSHDISIIIIKSIKCTELINFINLKNLKIKSEVRRRESEAE